MCVSVWVGQKVTIVKNGSKMEGERGVVESITDDDIAMVRTYGGRLVPCFFSEIEEV